MKNKVVIGCFIVFILLVIDFMIFFYINLNNYERKSYIVDRDINKIKDEIKLNSDKLSQIKYDNDIKYKNIENMNTYIDLLSKRVSEYE